MGRNNKIGFIHRIFHKEEPKDKCSNCPFTCSAEEVDEAYQRGRSDATDLFFSYARSRARKTGEDYYWWKIDTDEELRFFVWLDTRANRRRGRASLLWKILHKDSERR